MSRPDRPPAVLAIKHCDRFGGCWQPGHIHIMETGNAAVNTPEEVTCGAVPAPASRTRTFRITAFVAGAITQMAATLVGLPPYVRSDYKGGYFRTHPETSAMIWAVPRELFATETFPSAPTGR